MIHLDRNHHPSPLSTTAQNKDLILPTNSLHWSPLDDNGFPHVDQKLSNNAPINSADPRPASTTASPHNPAGGNSASPAGERSSSLSPAPSPRRPASAQATGVSASRQSTPLSEPPDDDDDPPKKESTPFEGKQLLQDAHHPGNHDMKRPQQSSSSMPSPSPSARTSPLGESVTTPSAASNEPSSPATGNSKVALMLELNEELLKVCMEFQKRKMVLAEPHFQAYSARLQSNLAWSARAVDHQQVMGQGNTLPMMDPPPPLDFLPTDRIQELYRELPKVFEKDLARRASASSPVNNLKRDRSEDLGDVMNKRRDTGETKMPMQQAGMGMMPPPPIPSPTNHVAPHTNGIGASPGGDSRQQQNTSPPIVDPQQRTRQAQAQLRQQQQGQQGHAQQANRQMSPPSTSAGAGNLNPGGPTNAVAGPSGGGGGGGEGGPGQGQPNNIQAAVYHMLRTPNHPFMQMMMRSHPGFQTLPVPLQMQKIQQALTQRQMQNAAAGGGGGPGGFSGGGQTSPVLPMGQMGGMGGGGSGGGGGGGPSFQMGNNAGMDPMRGMNSTPLPGGGGGGMGMPMNGISPQQRQQLMLMQQQQRAGGGGGGPGGGMGPGGMGMGGMPGMGMSPQQQQQMFQQQQERLRMEQQQRMAAQGVGVGSPPHPGSPMLGGNAEFPALRSNTGAIPGIARIARSPSDGPGPPGAGGMPGTPRMGPSRGPSLGAEDYQRAMMQQAQRGGMQNGGSFGQQGFAPQPTQGWPMQQSMGGGGGGGQFGMSAGGRPGSGYGGAPSPPGSSGGMGGGQNWGSGGYPYARSPSGGGGGGGMGPDLGMGMGMSSAPGQMHPQNGLQDADFDPFNWPA